jgi:hypothetical protein
MTAARVKSAIIFCLFLLLPAALGAITVMGDLTIETTTEAGGSYEGTITIANGGDREEEVKVYLTDYLFFADGRDIYGEKGKDPRSNADWLSFSPQRLIVPAKQLAGIRYSVKVPNRAVLSGSYWSMLMVEGLPTETPVEQAQTSTPDSPTTTVKTVMRYGIQIISDIGDSGSRQLRFLNPALSRDGGITTLQVDVENSGERFLLPAFRTELYDENGIKRGQFEGGTAHTLPGTSVRVKTDLGADVREGYRALFIADCGGDDLFGVSYAMKFGE